MASEGGSYFHAGPEADERVRGEVVVKLSPEVEESLAASIPSGPIRALVGRTAEFGVDALDKALSGFDVVAVARVHDPIPESVRGIAELAPVARDLGATYRVRLSPEAELDDVVAKLTRVKQVAEVSANYFRWAAGAPTDPMFGAQWGLARIEAPAAWNVTTGSPAVVVAVIDTGADLDHPDLQANLVAGQDLVDLAGVTPPPGTRFEGDFVGIDPLPEDEVGHGTHVAGTIAALTNTLGVVGVAPTCRIMPVRVLARVVRIADGRVSGSGTAVDIAAGIRWAVDHGARILNLSLGGYSDTFVERDAIAYAVGHGAIVVAAMGNDDTAQPSYPAAYPDVVAVGATDQQDRRASFSNNGPHIDVSGPGVGIRSTDWDNVYSDKSGTSMATPHVAGVAALVRSAAPHLTSSQVADVLRNTARPLRDAPSDPVPNDRYGHGLVNAAAAVRAAIPPPCRPCRPCRPCLPPPPCRPCRACVPPPPCRPCLPPPPCRPCVPPPPCRACVPPPPCRPCVPPPCIRSGAPYGSGYGGWEGDPQPADEPAPAEPDETKRAAAADADEPEEGGARRTSRRRK
jgi:subtilisin family serine protease